MVLGALAWAALALSMVLGALAWAALGFLESHPSFQLDAKAFLPFSAMERVSSALAPLPQPLPSPRRSSVGPVVQCYY
jgi:hypothetical protein